MDALERVARIGRAPAENRPRKRFLPAANEGKRRWQEAEELFGIRYPMFEDAVAVIAPDFRLPPEEEAAAREVASPGRPNVSNRITVWFVKWERCPATAGLPNPYEPWIEIWEHGGSFSVEHGQFVDLDDSEHIPAGFVMVRRA